MIHEWSCSIVDFLMRKTSVLKTSRRLNYYYKVETLLGKFIASVIVLLFSLLFGRPIEAAIFLFVSIKLGDYTGGYHTKSPVRCYLLTTASFIVTVVVTDIIVAYFPWLICSLLVVLSAVPIFLYAPVNHPNLNLDEDEIGNAKRKSRTLFVVIVLVSTIFAFIVPAQYPVSGIVSISIVSIFILFAKIIKQEVYYNDKKEKNHE